MCQKLRNNSLATSPATHIPSVTTAEPFENNSGHHGASIPEASIMCYQDKLTDGLAEQFNCTLKSMLEKGAVNKRQDWVHKMIDCLWEVP